MRRLRSMQSHPKREWKPAADPLGDREHQSLELRTTPPSPLAKMRPPDEVERCPTCPQTKPARGKAEWFDDGSRDANHGPDASRADGVR